jgi:hypothetical protein
MVPTPAVSVDVVDAGLDGAVHAVDVDKGLVSQVMLLEVFPVALDVVELRRVAGQPFDAEPVLCLRERVAGEPAVVDRAIIEHQVHVFVLSRRLKLAEEITKGSAVLGAGGFHDQLAAAVAARTEQGAFACLARGLDGEILAAPRPRARKIRMRGDFGLIGKEELKLAGLGTTLERAQVLARGGNGLGVLPPLERVPRSPAAEPPFLRNKRLIQDWQMRTPLRRSISCCKRGSVQGGSLASRGASRILSSSESARSPRCPGRPGEWRTRSPSAPAWRYRPRQCRIVSARAETTSAMAALLQPSALSKTARARSASRRSRDRLSASSACRCESLNTISQPLTRLAGSSQLGTWAPNLKDA